MNGVMEIASEVLRTLFSTRGQANSVSTKGVPRGERIPLRERRLSYGADVRVFLESLGL
jgi:hypothetical protein